LDETPDRAALAITDVGVGKAALSGSRERVQETVTIEVRQEPAERRSPERAATRRRYYPREGHVERRIAATRVRPVEDEWAAARREDHVVRVKVEVEQAMARADRRQSRGRGNLVQPLVELGKHGSVAAKRPWASAQLIEHRRSFDPIEHERVLGDLQDARHGIPVTVRVRHDESLSLRITAGSKAAEDAPVTKIEDLRGAPCGDELHSRRGLTCFHDALITDYD
jgi:hypothetical protein